METTLFYRESKECRQSLNLSNKNQKHRYSLKSSPTKRSMELIIEPIKSKLSTGTPSE